LGQLAYDKGMAIICASRGPAYEGLGSKNGVLTSALFEVLNANSENPKSRNPKLSLSAWFAAVQTRLPGVVSTDVKRALPNGSAPSSLYNTLQRPALFDFSRFKEGILR